MGNRHLLLEGVRDPVLAEAIFSLTNDGKLGAHDKSLVAVSSTFPYKINAESAMKKP